MFYPVGGTTIFKLLAMQEFGCVFLGDTFDRLYLDTFSKSIDGNDQELVSSSSLWKWS